MRIAFVGDFSDKLDEGYKNTSHYLAKWLEADGHQVTRLNHKRLGSLGFWKSCLSAHPQIIHLIAQPTHTSLGFACLAKRYFPAARLVVSALRPEGYFRNGRATLLQKAMLRLGKPDLVFLQSSATARHWRGAGCATACLPNGVDLERFTPAPAELKASLCRRYALDCHRQVVLSVGHLEEARNLSALEGLVDGQVQVLIAGSLYQGTHHALIRRLKSLGFIVLKGYQPRVEELYQAADCYVFPAAPGDSLSMPLSVLEAMACNLPVVTGQFPGLKQFFPAGDGITYVESSEQLVEAVRQALRAGGAPSTRERVKDFSWQSVVRQMGQYYAALVREGG